MNLIKKLFSNNLIKSAAICGLMLSPLAQSNAGGLFSNLLNLTGSADKITPQHNVITHRPLAKLPVTSKSETPNIHGRSHGISHSKLASTHFSSLPRVSELDVKEMLGEEAAQEYLKAIAEGKEPFARVNKSRGILRMLPKTPFGRLATLGVLGGLAFLNKDRLASTYNHIHNIRLHKRIEKELLDESMRNFTAAQDSLQARLNYIGWALYKGIIEKEFALEIANTLKNIDKIFYDKSSAKQNLSKEDYDKGMRKLEQKWKEINQDLDSCSKSIFNRHPDEEF